MPAAGRADPQVLADQPARWAVSAPDALLAVAVWVLDLVMFANLPGREGGPVPWVVIIGYAAVGSAALCWRQWAPVPVFAAEWLYATTAVLVPALAYFPMLALLVALYSVAVRCGARPALVALLASLVPGAFNIADVLRGAGDQMLEIGVSQTVATVALYLGTWGVGWLTRAGNLRAWELERRRQAAEDAITGERMRIARELHDIVAHSVTVMVLQAAGGQRLLRTEPVRAAQALGRIEDVGKQAMGELRRLLCVLRASEPGQGPDDGDAHQPGLADLDRLLASVHAAGVPAQLSQDGIPRPLDPIVDLTAYRIAQEALTNVTKYAGPGVPTVLRLSWTEAELVVQVTNAAPDSVPAGVPRRPGGYGLLGLRERVALVGGALRGGPAPDGGFAVTASLPVAGRTTALESHR
jgi:signal transduction histidine kinase